MGVRGRPKKVVESEPVDPIAVNEEEGPVVIKLSIPAELYEVYSDLAENQDLTVAELMIHRLRRCVSHSSIRSLYFSESQLRQLESLIQKRPLESADQAMATLSEAFKYQVGEFEPIPITPYQAKRISLGAIGGQTPYDKLKYIVQGAVAKATGI